ncbi:DNA topoisomerase 3 [Klebsiella pneumoniae]|nr:DNA topoisomerase 3 [Klebsiella pneumoniae]
MDLYICEKPSQAKDLAGVMKASQRGDGFLHDGGNRVITWAFGHLLELYMPDDYDERYKSWSLETLPIAPESWLLMIMQNSTKLGRKDRVKMIHLIALLHSLFLQGIIWNALYGNYHQSPTSFS